MKLPYNIDFVHLKNEELMDKFIIMIDYLTFVSWKRRKKASKASKQL